MCTAYSFKLVLNVYCIQFLTSFLFEVQRLQLQYQDKINIEHVFLHAIKYKFTKDKIKNG